jgi:hypothetical protein
MEWFKSWFPSAVEAEHRREFQWFVIGNLFTEPLHVGLPREKPNVTHKDVVNLMNEVIFTIKSD